MNYDSIMTLLIIVYYYVVLYKLFLQLVLPLGQPALTCSLVVIFLLIFFDIFIIFSNHFRVLAPSLLEQAGWQVASRITCAPGSTGRHTQEQEGTQWDVPVLLYSSFVLLYSLCFMPYYTVYDLCPLSF
jgi:hypothetical protein